MRRCTNCEVEKSLDDFPTRKAAKSGLSSWCRECHASWSKQHKQKPEYREKYLDYRYQRNYGLTYAQVMSMWDAQGNACAICGCTDGLGKNNWPSVDHCHETGQIRGLLCHDCNTMLGFAKDQTAILAEAIVYLERSKSANAQQVH